MSRVPVISSNIAAIGYDDSAQVLEVEFRNGRVYQYLNVPFFVHEQFMSATSKGTFFNHNIMGRYPYERTG